MVGLEYSTDHNQYSLYITTRLRGIRLIVFLMFSGGLPFNNAHFDPPVYTRFVGYGGGYRVTWHKFRLPLPSNIATLFSYLLMAEEIVLLVYRVGM